MCIVHKFETLNIHFFVHIDGKILPHVRFASVGLRVFLPGLFVSVDFHLRQNSTEPKSESIHIGSLISLQAVWLFGLQAVGQLVAVLLFMPNRRRALCDFFV